MYHLLYSRHNRLKLNRHLHQFMQKYIKIIFNQKMNNSLFFRFVTIEFQKYQILVPKYST